MMQTVKIGFIGAGNMAEAIIKGLVNAKLNHNIYIYDHNPERMKILQNQYQVSLSRDIQELMEPVNIVVLAVKPQNFVEALQALKPHYKQQVLLSVAAGIEVQLMEQVLGNASAKIVRSMPNTPASINLGASALFANAHVTAQEKLWVETIMQACGICVWLENETLISSVVALSGSGPAYYFLFLEIMEKVGIEMGLTAEISHKLALQTAVGATSLAHQSNEPPSILRGKVTSPNGTTFEAIRVFQTQGLEEIIRSAMQACFDRNISLSKEISTTLK